jgi:AcrR family transcriptional regulator
MAADPHKPAKTRTRQTRDWIIESFNRLVLRRRYSDISVAELANRAGVGRSTFYEHFGHKDDVLRSAVRVILEPMAQLVREEPGDGDAGGGLGVIAVIEDVREQKAAAMAMLEGEARVQLEQALQDLVVDELSRLRSSDRGAMVWLLGAQIACAQLGLLRAWLEAPTPVCTAAELAAMMRASTRAMVAGAG